MRTYNHLYSDFNTLKNFIAENNITDSKQILVRIHTDCHNKSTSVSIAKEVSTLLPSASVMGMSVYAIIYNSRVVDKCCLISISVFEKSTVEVRPFSFVDKTAAILSAEVCSSLCKKNTSVHFTFCSDYYPEAHFYVEKFNNIAPEVKLIGGIAAEIPGTNEPPFVFDQNGVYEKSLLVGALSSDELQTYSNVMIGHDPIGDVHKLTKTTEDEWQEIDGVNAVDWFNELFGISEQNVYNDEEDINSLIVNFPLVLEGHHGASRCVCYSKEENKIRAYGSRISEGTVFRISYLNPRSSALQCRKICRQMELENVESIFAYSCFLKREAMHNCSEWELTPYVNTDMSGAFTFGELGNIFDHNEYFNGSCSLLALAENETRLEIDNSAFEKMMTIDDDRKDLHNYVLKRQGEYMYKRNKQLAQLVMQQNELVNKKLFVDKSTGIENSTKFMYDNESGIYDKLCMISIEKGEMLKSHFGHKIYEKIQRENIANMRTLLNDANNDLIHYYQYDSHAFIIVAKPALSKEEFLAKTQELFINYGNFNTCDLNIPCINHFAVVLERGRMLEKASMTLSYAAQNGERFMVYQSNNGIDDDINQSMHWINIINEAIHEDRVIPYFHPIYNNRTGEIRKFESLMRIADGNGTIYYPGQFMGIAKEYRIYLQLSKMMITKVFDLFDDRDDMVSINLTATDIESKEIKLLILNRLRELKHPEHFIFEIVESDEFKDFDMLMTFIKNVRDFGVKIAIDDFGAGYSNLIEIAKIAPDFIKIDGEITRNFMSDDSYKSIMLTVCYLASRLKVDLIAEYVENMAIQKKIVELNIAYTQGYCYSQPLPYDKIDDFCKSFNEK